MSTLRIVFVLLLLPELVISEATKAGSYENTDSTPWYASKTGLVTLIGTSITFYTFCSDQFPGSAAHRVLWFVLGLNRPWTYKQHIERGTLFKELLGIYDKYPEREDWPEAVKTREKELATTPLRSRFSSAYTGSAYTGSSLVPSSLLPASVEGDALADEIFALLV
ncbi:hypothetical protein OEA41_000679 [Lepraria neglecta]|uniref:Uncharacterized protein n=1 Tax=Lepraria neglecta TaxID=209136 RepID=A0AAE0DQ16_9LECA|nr:hypothetical protein OEA41_000679 [Lepraria neglecta]